MNQIMRLGAKCGCVLFALCVLLAAPAFASAANEPSEWVIDAFALSPTLQESIGKIDEKERRTKTTRPLKLQRQDTLFYLDETLTGKISPLKGVFHRAGAPGIRITDLQRENLQRLNAQAPEKQAVRVIFDHRNGTPAFLKTKTIAKGSFQRSDHGHFQAESIARKFLRNNRDLLKLNSPDHEMELFDSWSDPKGTSHFKYQQVVDGVPVFGKQLIVHVDASYSVYLVNGRFEPTPDVLQTTPAINPGQALESVFQDLGATDLAVGDTELVIYTQPCGEMVLTYQIAVDQGLTEAWTYFVDAIDARVVHRMTRIHGNVVNASGRDRLGVQRTFKAWRSGNMHYLVDATMPSTTLPGDPVSSVASPGNTYVLDARNGESSVYHITSGSATSGWDPSGVSLMANIRATHEYYKGTFGWNGLDNNYRNFMGIVNVGQNYANAFWSGTFVGFGNGDGTHFNDLAAALDIVAHEIQHGITEFTAGLKYENQSGALNEAYSDVFACMVDDRKWTVGDDVIISQPGYLRNLADPSKGLSSLPTRMSEYQNLPNTKEGDWGGVHINMSIPSRAGYLMAEGLSVEGWGTSIGRDKTAQIWFRALTTYLTPYSQFIDGRKAQVQAAEDLYGANSMEVAAVRAAYDVVEVYGDDGPPAPPSPTPGDVVPGDDINVYLYPSDHTHDRPYHPDEKYRLYALLNAGSGYEEDNDEGPLDPGTAADRPRYTKPAASTFPNGRTIIFYATETYNLNAVVLDAHGRYDYWERVLQTNNIYSIALSPDRRYFAFTTDDATDNHIYVLDLESNRSAAIPIVSASDVPYEDAILNTIEYADSLAFDYTSKTLAFDALNCISTEASRCSQGGGFRYWSIGFMALADDPADATKVKGTVTFPLPDQDPALDLAYPAFAANNSYVVAADVVNFRNYPVIESMVWTLNTANGQAHRVADPNLETIKERIVHGVPTFWGDDRAITIQRLNNANGTAYRVPIDANWAGPADSRYQGNPTITRLNDYAMAMPVMHRRASRAVLGQITFSARSFNFGSVPMGSRVTETLTLENESGKDIRIQHINLDGPGHYTHNGTNTFLPRGSELAITIAYAPTSAGATSATLSFTSDADNHIDQISLSGSGTTTGGGTGGDDGGAGAGGGGGGGGCMVATLLNTPVPNHNIGIVVLLCVFFFTALAAGRRHSKKDFRKQKGVSV